MTSREPARVRTPIVVLSGLFASLALVVGLLGTFAPAKTARAQDEPREFSERLDGVNGFEGYGRVKFIEQGDQTRVIVAIHEVIEGQFIPAIYAGTCDSYSGEPAFPLAPFPWDDRSRTTVDITFDDLLSGAYLVDIHPITSTSNELFDPAAAVVCGNVLVESDAIAEPTIGPVDQPSDPNAIEVTSPPVTGFGPVGPRYWSTITVAVLAAFAILFAAAGFDLRRRSFVTVAQRRLYRLTGREL